MFNYLLTVFLVYLVFEKNQEEILEKLDKEVSDFDNTLNLEVLTIREALITLRFLDKNNMFKEDLIGKIKELYRPDVLEGTTAYYYKNGVIEEIVSRVFSAVDYLNNLTK